MGKCRYKRLNECVSKRFSNDKIINLSKKDDFLSYEYVVDNFQSSMDYLRNLESNTEVKVVDFILANYKKVKLFHHPAHPANIMLKEVVKRVLAILELLKIRLKEIRFLRRN